MKQKTQQFQDEVEQRRSLNEHYTFLAPMQVQQKVQKNLKFGISTKAYTQSSDNITTTLRTQFHPSKNLQTTERFLFDADASMIYAPPKARSDSIEEIQLDKYYGSFKDLNSKIPKLSDKLNHLMTLTNLFDGDKRIFTVMAQICKILEQVSQFVDDKQSEIRQLNQDMHLLKDQQIHNQKIIDEQQQIIKQKERDYTNHSKIQKTFQRSNQLALVNVQLEKRIEYLQQTIIQLQNQNKESYTAKLEQQIENLKEQIGQLQQKIFKLSEHEDQLLQQIRNLKNAEIKYQIQLKKIDDTLVENEQKLIKQNLSLLNLLDQNESYREQLAMTAEDLHSLKMNTYEQNRSVQKNLEKIRLLQKRIDDITVKRSKEIDGPLANKMDGDMIQLQTVVKILDQDTTFQRYMMSSFTKNVQAYDQRLIDAIVDVKRLIVGRDNDVELKTLKYNYPQFVTFLDKRTIDNESYYLPQRALSQNFMAILRSIMDGMYFEFQKEKYPSFQAYVIDWLSNYTIDKHDVIKYNHETKRQTIEENIISFYLDLMVPRLDKVWEVVQFRHFLNDIYCQEELYFYLHARFIIRNGPWMNTFDAHYCVMHYIQLQAAEFVIKRYMIHFDKLNQTLVLRAIQDRIVEGRGDRKLVQTGFILQLLLEIFRIDRNNRYKMLSFAFPQQPVNFKSFHKFFKGNFDKCTEADCADIWRETFMISNGIPNLNSFFIAAQPVFIKSIKMPNIFQLPVLDSNNKIAFDEENFAAMKIIDALKKYQKQDVLRIQKFLLQHFQNDDLAMFHYHETNQSSVQQILIMINKLSDIRLQVELNQRSVGPIKSKIDPDKYMAFIQAEFDSLVKVLKQEDLDFKDQNVRVRRLQRLARKKIQKLYLIINTVLTSRIKQ